MSTRIVTDSVADLPPALAETLGITVVPQLVQFGAEGFRDRVDLSADQFYARLAQSRDLPTTAAAAPGQFAQVYAGRLAEGGEVVSLHVAAGLSGVYNAARIGASEFEGRVHLFDSRSVTMGQGWLAVHAGRAAQDGASALEVVDLCDRLAPRVRVWALLDTLEFLQRGGRIGAAQAFVGSLLQFKPILLIQDSAVHPSERVRTLRKALDRLVELVKAAGPATDLAILHAAAPELAAEVGRRLADHHPADRMVVSEVGPVVGVHAGPGAVGVAALLAE